MAVNATERQEQNKFATITQMKLVSPPIRAFLLSVAFLSMRKAMRFYDDKRKLSKSSILFSTLLYNNFFLIQRRIGGVLIDLMLRTQRYSGESCRQIGL
jgi:hypothetical protein